MIGEEFLMQKLSAVWTRVKTKIDRNKNVVSVHIRCSNCSACPCCIHTILIVLRHPFKSQLTTTIYNATFSAYNIYIYILWIMIFMYFIITCVSQSHTLHTYIICTFLYIIRIYLHSFRSLLLFSLLLHSIFKYIVLTLHA